jgi:hypothetical protein
MHTLFVVRNLAGPLGDVSESFLYEYLAYFFSENLSLGPLPSLSLLNDQNLYPFGGNLAAQSFCVERDLLYTALHRLFGAGPWLQLYYIAGVSVATFGTYVLLRTRHGDVRAAAVAALVNLWNFYAIQKYPYHYNMAVIHWTTLGIVCDYVVVETVVERRGVTLSLCVLRGFLLIAAFGLELGHVLGFSLTSMSVSIVYIAAIAVVRRVKGVPIGLFRGGDSMRAEIKERWRGLVFLSCCALVCAALYGPLVLDLVRGARQYQYAGESLGVWWAHPIRLLIPYAPDFHPSVQPRFLHVLGDQAEVGIGGGGVGWFLLLLGCIGVVQSRRRLVLVPVLAMMTLYIVSRPGFDLIRWMPWFSFMRVMSRSTVVYSVLLGLAALHVDFARWGARARWYLLVLGFVGAVEAATIVGIKLAQPAYSFDAEFRAHMELIRRTPGEAILDFPFCILGGNGNVGELCPFVGLNSVFALQRFHHKKVIGAYLGRLHPAQVEGFLKQGWRKLIDPDHADYTRARTQIRCLAENEWEFFEAFYAKNAFSGIQLAIDFLPPGCPEEFYRRFGAPVGQIRLPSAGSLVFLPKSHRVWAEATALGDRAVVLDDDFAGPSDIVSRTPSKYLQVSGLADFEWNIERNDENEHWRWGLLPETEVSFRVRRPRLFRVRARLKTDIRPQVIEVLVDGRKVAEWAHLPFQEWTVRETSTRIQAGSHTLTFRYAFGNVGEHVWAPKDERPMSVAFSAVVLEMSDE